MMMMMTALPVVFLLVALVTILPEANAFGLATTITTTTSPAQPISSSLYSTVSEDLPSDLEVHDELTRTQLKRSALQLGASYDRGFGATARVQDKMASILKDLEAFNPEPEASRGIDGGGDSSSSPLEGNWRMIWTTAQDVLVLGASPVLAVGAIYQFIDPPVITNVIDFLPRIQNLLPQNVVPSSVLRAEVTTRASSRSDEPKNRVGLTFERVSLNPQQLLGQDVSKVLPPVGFDLPRLPDSLMGGGDSSNSSGVGYFDVSYLDEDLLVIRQNAPGGCFVLVKVEDTDP